jgi:hypothetical protein
VIGRGVLALARPGWGLYLDLGTSVDAAGMLLRSSLFIQMVAMALPLSTPQQVSPSIQPSHRVGQAIAAGAASLGAVLLLGALALWFYYGTTVFFETIAAGISACF